MQRASRPQTIDERTVFAGRWQVVEPLACGSTSEVFRGRDREGGGPVAIKVLRPDFAQNEEALQRFRREARVAQQLSHPNIVQVRDFGVDAGCPWITMELLEGETLELRLEREPLSPAHAVEVVAQIAEAVDHAHAAGIVHRDLKPDNCFLLAGDGLRVKVLDFGYAKLLDSIQGDGLRTASNALLGTPLYMSPEQIRSSATVDPRTDLWSLGVMAYELLAGRPPWEQRAAADLFVEILSRPLPPITGHAPWLPRALDRWALRALDRDPDARFPSGAELARALRGAMDPANAVRAQAPTARYSVAPRPAPRRSRAREFAALALIALASALATWLTTRGR